jgi:hypothetical protein
MSSFKRIITDTAEEVLVEMKQYEKQHPKINAIFVKGDKTNLILDKDCTNLVSPPKYGVSLEFN